MHFRTASFKSDLLRRWLETALQELTWCDRRGQYTTEILDHLGRMRNAIGAADYSLAERGTLLDQADFLDLMQVQNLQPGDKENQ